MTIDKLGFLSGDIHKWIRKHRAENQEWFDFAENLNRLAHRQWGLVTASGDDNQTFLGGLLFVRGLSSFQGAILMAERGMTTEARILTRTCFEAVFCLAAVSRDPSFVDLLVGDDASRKRTLARSLLKLRDGPAGLSSEDAEKLTEWLNGLSESEVATEPLRVEYAARIAGLSDVYDVFYRGLSNDAVHPSITALNRHVSVDDGGRITGYRWGPAAIDIKDTIITICTAAVYLVTFANELFKQDDVQADLASCWTKYKQLTGEL